MHASDDARPVGIVLTQLRRPGAGPRWLTELDPRTASMYALLVHRHAQRVEASLDPGVIANRVGPRGTLRPLPASRAAWRRRLVRMLRPDAPLAVVSSDVYRCYPSVQGDALGLALAECAIDPGDIGELLRLLGRIARAGAPGLPIGPEASAVLANAVLATADRAAIRAGMQLIRWVDDVVLVGPDRSSVMRGFEAWANGLRVLGLRPNEGKTRMWPSGEEALAALGIALPSGA
jgi:hypothetical protein